MRTADPSTIKIISTLGASFRDPAGFIFHDSKGAILRQINLVGRPDYDQLMESGLYDELVDNGLMVKHKTLGLSSAANKYAYQVIKPETIPYISYPFEWSFSQLRDAALLTLKVQKLALKYDMSLKDASAYNIQFLCGKPIFIDTLSFEKYEAGLPWQAYRQFCQHFLAPLSLMAYTNINLSQLLRVHLDGIPLDLTTRLLPARIKFQPGMAMHVVLHGRAQKSKESSASRPTKRISKNGLIGITDSLQRTIKRLKSQEVDTEWGDYYDKTNYSSRAKDQKSKLIIENVKSLKIKTALDLGGNNGRYSRLLHDQNILTVCTDIDPNAVEENYQIVKQNDEQLMLPLLVDLSNPGGALGWGNEERQPIHERFKCDLVFALALIHHLAISNNLPLEKIAEYFSKFGPYLLIEFVPKGDSQVNKLLATRKDIFPDYTKAGMETAFAKYFRLIKSNDIKGSKRTLYLYARKSHGQK